MYIISNLINQISSIIINSHYPSQSSTTHSLTMSSTSLTISPGYPHPNHVSQQTSSQLPPTCFHPHDIIQFYLIFSLSWHLILMLVFILVILYWIFFPLSSHLFRKIYSFIRAPGDLCGVGIGFSRFVCWMALGAVLAALCGLFGVWMCIMGRVHCGGLLGESLFCFLLICSTNIIMRISCNLLEG